MTKTPMTLMMTDTLLQHLLAKTTLAADPGQACLQLQADLKPYWGDVLVTHRATKTGTDFSITRPT